MWQSVKVPFLTIIFALLSLFVFTKIFGPIPFSVQSIVTNKQNLFSVTESAEVTAIPETASVTLGVNKQSSTVETAKDEVNTIINQITKDLKSIGVDEKDIKTTNYTVNPNYEFSSGTQEINGYNVSANISVNLDSVDKANQAIDIATKTGATNVGGVQFILDEETEKELENKARTEAIDKAKKKAKDLADAAGIKLGRIVDVQESGGGQPPMYYDTQLSLNAEKAVQTELNPGENKIISNITLFYETY